MTRAEWSACVRDLLNEEEAAQRSGDPARIQGVAMAMNAFLSCVRIPPPEDAKDKESSP